MIVIYNIVVRSYYFIIWLFAHWNSKARKWIHGRQSWKEELQGIFKEDDRVIWVHCSSLGEFEQGRPIIEKLKERSSGSKVLITFFSPSGYEKRKNYAFADHVAYLPLDTRRNAENFLELVPVEKAIFIKYEFWFHFLFALHKQKIPLYLVSGIFRRSQLFFKWYAVWYRKLLYFFTHFFVQDEDSLNALGMLGLKNVTVSGDSRFDRVLKISSNVEKYPALEKYAGGRPVLIAGSTWMKDERLLKQVCDNVPVNLNFIIAPHEPTFKTIERLKRFFPNHLLLSEINGNPVSERTVIIVNTIGHLSSLYQYADIAYIGGGFSKGIHNILEAAAASMPVIFGPNYINFREANELVELGAAFPVQNAGDALTLVRKFLENADELRNKSKIARNYTEQHGGATNIILDHIFN
ncbi:MAG: 3-deoxy-D-manno-octulosonic acid transferase [Bacteroidales bacterium]|nr:3-deoxy-D-manno-octulosonic acid transferase [Bacteroidales bacterium]